MKETQVYKDYKTFGKECFVPTVEGVINCDNLYRKIKTDRIGKRARIWFVTKKKGKDLRFSLSSKKKLKILTGNSP